MTNEDKGRNLKVMLKLLEATTVLKVNIFLKSDLVSLSIQKSELHKYWGQNGGLFSFSHLGLPLTSGSVKNSDWNKLIINFERRNFGDGREGFDCRGKMDFIEDGASKSGYLLLVRFQDT